MLIDFKLYLITDRKLFADDYSLFTAVEEALKGGAKAVQLREKDMAIRELMNMAYSMRDLTNKYGVKLFINDRVDVAIASGADGVHLGNTGMPAYAARKVVQDRMLIGVSTHGIEEAVRAKEDGADFVTLGPVYETPSKKQYGNPLGTDMLRKVSDKIDIPVFAIGGIQTYRVNEVMDAGAYGVALISAVLSSENPQKTTKEFMRLLK